MRHATRVMLNKAFTGMGIFSIGIMALAMAVLLVPIFRHGAQAYVFRGTVEYRKMMLNEFHRGDVDALAAECAQADQVRAPIYAMMNAYEAYLNSLTGSKKREAVKQFRELKENLAELLGPAAGGKRPVLARKGYGATRWDRAEVKLKQLLYAEEWQADPKNPGGAFVPIYVERATQYAGTPLEPMFAYLRDHVSAMLRPKWTFYGHFLTDSSVDSHFFGGIGPEVLGTLYLALGAVLLAVPVGIVAAIYLCEYARPGRLIDLIRTCISTLAGVPSIVFGLFGLAFFLNTVRVSDNKSVLAGCMTLALMILPTVIRSTEEALLSVPGAYKEAAFGLGAGRWYSVMKVIMPAAAPGIITGIIISLGRAAGETAPIIFTAAVSMGAVPGLREIFSQPTPALPWNIYNLSTEHEAIGEIMHVQYGMVMTLVALVLTLNIAAIVLRANISKKLKG